MDIDDIAYHRITRGAVHHEFIGTDADFGVMKIRHLSTNGGGGAGGPSATLAVIDERANIISGAYEPTLYVNRTGASIILFVPSRSK